MLCEKPLQKIGFRRALLLIKPAHTGHHPGAVPGFRPSPGNSEETTTRVLRPRKFLSFSGCLPGIPHTRDPRYLGLYLGTHPPRGLLGKGPPGFSWGEVGTQVATQVMA